MLKCLCLSTLGSKASLWTTMEAFWLLHLAFICLLMASGLSLSFCRASMQLFSKQWLPLSLEHCSLHIFRHTCHSVPPNPLPWHFPGNHQWNLWQLSYHTVPETGTPPVYLLIFLFICWVVGNPGPHPQLLPCSLRPLWIPLVLVQVLWDANIKEGLSMQRFLCPWGELMGREPKMLETHVRPQSKSCHTWKREGRRELDGSILDCHKV